MSTYTTQAAILGEIQMKDLVSLTDDSPSTGTLNVDVLNQVIANASGYIDRKIANIYGQQLPFNPVPLSVSSMALTVACYRLYRRRLVPDEKNIFYPDFKDVEMFLNKVNTGELHLDDVPSRDFPQGAMTGQPTIYGNQPFGSGPIVNTM